MFEKLWKEVYDMRDEQLAEFKDDLDLRNKLRERWLIELTDCMKPLVDCKKELERILQPPQSCNAMSMNAEIDVATPSTTHQGGPEPARPGQQRTMKDAAIQVTPPPSPPPPTVSKQSLKIDLSKMCPSDTSHKDTTDRYRLRYQNQPAESSFLSEIPSVHDSPRRRCANLSKKKVAGQPNPLSGSSSDDSSRSPLILRQEEALPRSRPASNKSTSPFGRRGSASTDLWAVAKVCQRRSPSGEEETSMNIMRVDTKKPCDVSRYPVGGVLKFNTSVFNGDDQCQ